MDVSYEEVPEVRSFSYRPVLILSIAQKFELKNGVLMRRVHLRARAGPANTKTYTTAQRYDVRSHWENEDGWESAASHLLAWLEEACGGICALLPVEKGKDLEMLGKPIKDLSSPFTLVVLDAIGPLPTTDRCNKYILVRSVPDRLLSDRGTNFTSELARSLYQALTQGLNYGLIEHWWEWCECLYMKRKRIGISACIVFGSPIEHHNVKHWPTRLSLVSMDYGRDSKLCLDLAFLNTDRGWKTNGITEYRRKIYQSLHDTRRMVERLLIKAQDRHGCRHPTVLCANVGENAYRIEILNHPDEVVTLMESIDANEVPVKVNAGLPDEEVQLVAEDRPLVEDDLPATSIVEWLPIDGSETPFTGVCSPVIDSVAKQTENRYEILGFNSHT
ncbi:hypothetical protein PHMEG_0005969 [Phytophthora megakarya]|uniref:Uncharacterized protein n=1 Tax=Phytophthora megakarya TaxID=4795 RepID=A0A225WS04_9STRA|nr:hypothetical protein PHMEG_0005969 [Phytophthora megakarya]